MAVDIISLAFEIAVDALQRMGAQATTTPALHELLGRAA